MRKFSSYKEAEEVMIENLVFNPEFKTAATSEIFNTGFVLTNPANNRNDRSNYEYADHFFKWLLTGDTSLSKQLVDNNPWVQRFVDSTGLPEGFSSSYGFKIKQQLEGIIQEIKRNYESRRGYINILYPDDHVILGTKSTMEFPCTIGFQFLLRNGRLHMIVNMRSNNCYAVMPYDVYNFTELQSYVSDKLNVIMGNYYHQINNAHIFKGDIRRWQSENP